MANFLAQFQTIKNSCDHVVIAVEDVSDLWPTIKNGFEKRFPLKRACLNNKTRNPIYVDYLPAEFILTRDARLCSRFPQEQYLFWFREPYATVVLVTCEDLDEFKTILKPRLKLIVQNDEREWFIVFVSKAHPNNDQATKMAKKVYAKLEVNFSTKKRERCCKFDLHSPEANFWEDLESKIVECVRNTLDKRVQFYEDEIRKLSEQRFMPVWNFCNFFILKESLAFIFEIAHFHEDALREYFELEICYTETGAVATAVAEVTWVKSLLHELGVLIPQTPTIYCDNVGTTYLYANPVFHSRMKHIAIDFHFVRDKVQSGELRVSHVSAADQLVDALMKPLTRQHLQQFCVKIGVFSRHSILRGHDKESDKKSKMWFMEYIIRCKYLVITLFFYF